jgi:hypothetical protein
MFRNLYMRSLLFWDVTQPIVIVRYRRFGSKFRSHLQGSSLTLQDVTDTLPRNVGNYESTLRNIPEERRKPEIPQNIRLVRVLTINVTYKNSSDI